MLSLTPRRPRAIAALVGLGADVNALDDARTPPLHLAAADGELQSVALLLRHGARPVSPLRPLRTRITTCYPYGVERGPCVVPRLHHVILMEWRWAPFSYQDLLPHVILMEW